MVKSFELDEKELSCLKDSSFLLTKYQVNQKIIAFFNQLAEDYREQIEKHQLSHLTGFKSAKISKGENYLQLPYYVLDIPRRFQSHDTLAIRTIIRWGHEISITLMAGGNSKQSLAIAILNNHHKLNDYFLGINPNPWQHHFGKDNYTQMSALTHDDLAQIVTNNQWIKVAYKWPLSNFSDVKDSICDRFDMLLALIASVYR